MRQRVALVATLARLYVGVVLIDRECECRGHRRRIVGVVYDHMCQQQCDQRIGYAAGLRPGNMSQIGARSAYLALRDFDPANVSCGSRLCKNPQKLYATGDDPHRHDGLSIFLLYRVRSQLGRKLGPR